MLVIDTELPRSRSGRPPATTTSGSYPISIGPNCSPSCTDAGAYATLWITDWTLAGGSYTGNDLGHGASGTATLTQLDTQTVAGAFDCSLVAADGGVTSVSGTFSGPFCVKQQ